MDQRAKDLIKQGDHLYGKRVTLESLWQELADNFYVERADFTRQRTLGDDMASHLMTSYPLMVRRELQNAISTYLRPSSTVWFTVGVQRQEKLSQQGKVWLEWARDVMYRAMYDRSSQFVRASKEGDGDFVTCGQCVKQATLNRLRNGLLFRCWNLRDVVWADDYEGFINTVHRKWKPGIAELASQFPGKMHPNITDELAKPDCDPFREAQCRHVVVLAERYDTGKKWKNKYVSVYIDVENEHVIEEVSVPTLGGYVIPRWVTVSGGWQYAFSPATTVALPDARLMQALTRVLLEAGEKAVYPPMLAAEQSIRGDMNMFAGGTTWVEARYAGELDKALVQFRQDTDGLEFGLKMTQDGRQLMRQAFYLDQLDLPNRGPEMTAFEVSQRVQQYIRNATPLFEPIEFEDNGAMCEEVFGLMLRNGAFGRHEDIPQSLQGQETQFRFVSPLTQALGVDKQTKFTTAGQLIQQAMQLDPGAAAEVDVRTALRDTLEGVQTPAKWINSLDDSTAIRTKIAQDQAASAQAQEIGQGAEVMKKGADAVTSLKGALAPAPQQAQAA